MKRVVASVLMSALCVGVFAYNAEDAGAQRRRRRAAQQQQQQQPREEQTPHSDAIAPMMEEVQWGWSRQQLLRHFSKKIQEEYRPRLAKAPGAIEEDRLRHEMSERIARIRESYVQFDGQTSGHDSGFLRFEFTHNNGEAMMRVQQDTSDDYFFFINNRLWKWYRAFNSRVFGGADFEQFAGALQGRLGPARERTGALHEGASDQSRWLEWQDDATRARAIDNNRFYGFYCLVFEEKATLDRLTELRRNASRRGNQGHALVDAVVLPEGGGAEGDANDSNADIADRITGRIRNRQNAPEGSTPNRGSGSRTAPAPAPGPQDDDPLRGI